MRLLIILLTFLFAASQAIAGNSIEDLWQKLKRDFDSKPHFFNDAINDQRMGVMSPFIPALFGEFATNNAVPLTPQQLKKIPEARFVDLIPFTLAIAGRERLIRAGKIKNNPILAITDFSRHSRFRRFYILDIEKGEVLINTWVSHAYASDTNSDGLAETFSNVSGSNMSSVGFMVADVTYNGTYGFSQRLKGLDPILNSNVLPRGVVIHGFGGLGAQQVANGSVSTSQGCLMFSTNESGLFWGMEDKPMIELVIKSLEAGALVFNYTDEIDSKEKGLIFKSQWITEADLPDLSNEYDPAVELVSHSSSPAILNARKR